MPFRYTNGYPLCNHQPCAREFSWQECHHKEHLPGFPTLCINKARICVALFVNSSVLPKSDHLPQRQPSRHFIIIVASFLDIHKEPYLAFINPPVTECVQCEETLYSFARVAVTLYNLSGPIPGQRGVLKCKSCQMYYHVDGYSMPSQGKAYFIRYQVPASGKVLATECFGAKTCTLKSLHCWIKSLNLT